MFSTDTNVKFRINRFSEFDSHLHKFTNTCLVKFSKWIVLEDLSVTLDMADEINEPATGRLIEYTVLRLSVS